MRNFPRIRALDSSLALLREGYAFVPNRCRAYRTDAFRTRLMGQRVLCVTGAEAAEMFYGGERFTRRGALPRTVLHLLQDEGSVQALDGEPHRHRKQMFLDLLTSEGLDGLVDATAEGWSEAVARWARADELVLLTEVREILCRAVCRWAGVPLPERDVARRAADLGALIDGAGSVGPRLLRGALARRRTERWIGRLVTAVRQRRTTVAEGSPVATVLAHRGPGGEPLDTAVAAVELINLLRPTVAVSRFVVFAALALHEHPHARAVVRDGDDGDVRRFAQEVRRFYPFFPAVGGRARFPFDWRGHRFAAGDWVLLDLYGTNHDGARWERPGVFDPERFRGWAGDEFAFVAQGGGDHLSGHRCPGEWATIAIMEVAVATLARRMTYDVPAQDLRISLARLPAVPSSRFRIADVRPAQGRPGPTASGRAR